MSKSAISRRNTLIPREVDVAQEGSYRPVDGDRVAFLASYSAEARVSKSLAEFIRQLRALNYEVILIRASDNPAPLEWPGNAPADVVVLRKPNLGYDFGSWAVGMDRFSELLSREFVLLVNDSLVGPFATIEPIIRDFEEAVCDAWGVTRSTQFMPHLQSYFLGFKNQTLCDPSVRQFWNNLPIETDKNTIVQLYEMTFTRLLFAEGFVATACFESARVVIEGENPTIVGWRRLLDLGFPFIKRTIVAAPDLVSDGWSISATVQKYFDANVVDWL
ncbi:MAG: hypothetical protein QOH69_2552 [Actinomycetota bacterium]|jgi:lipopolysaccharide biosynthesis protein|nr:hypothetical protein [Actinomycetota bacterium]